MKIIVHLANDRYPLMDEMIFFCIEVDSPPRKGDDFVLDELLARQMRNRILRTPLRLQRYRYWLMDIDGLILNISAGQMFTVREVCWKPQSTEGPVPRYECHILIGDVRPDADYCRAIAYPALTEELLKEMRESERELEHPRLTTLRDP